MKICAMNRIRGTQFRGIFETNTKPKAQLGPMQNHEDIRILIEKISTQRQIGILEETTITRGNRGSGTGSCFDISVFTAKKLRIRRSISGPILATAFLWPRTGFYYIRVSVQNYSHNSATFSHLRRIFSQTWSRCCCGNKSIFWYS